MSLDDELNFVRELRHITLARVLVSSGRKHPGDSHLDGALELLSRLLEKAETAGWIGKAIEVLALQAVALEV